MIHKVKTTFFSIHKSCVFIASYSQSTSSELQDCNVTYVNDVISTMCFYSGSSSATGFQIIVQLNNVTEVHKLLVNCTTEHLSPGPVTVQVNESGSYHVAIFPVMGERGIPNTSVEHSQELFINKGMLYYYYASWCAAFVRW